MNILEVRQIVAEALQKSEGFEKVFPLGNVVYVYVDGVEYEVVLRTVRPDYPRRSDGTENTVP